MRNLVFAVVFAHVAIVVYLVAAAYSGRWFSDTISPAYATFAVIPVAIFGVPAVLLAVYNRLLEIALKLALAIPASLVALFLFAAYY
ncbi:MAG: hypothetical protein KDJ16_13055 [Hyphomicrobiales bacterium]|nr:hypothetical protein [Hyphomicrobiales bacterium]